MAAAYLDAAYEGAVPERLGVVARNRATWSDVVKVGRSGLGSPLTSSAGRLFDAVAAVAGVRDAVNYEGQAAIELEQLASPCEGGGYRASIAPGRPFGIAGAELVRAAADDMLAGVAPAVVAARFHQGVAAAVAGACELVRERTGLGTVALSGGVFQNLRLAGLVAELLGGRGFRVLTHSRVPPNDGGLSLGQAAIAGAIDRARRG